MTSFQIAMSLISAVIASSLVGLLVGARLINNEKDVEIKELNEQLDFLIAEKQTAHKKRQQKKAKKARF